MKTFIAHYAIPLAAGAVSFVLIPDVNTTHPTINEVTPFFATMTVLFATLLVPLSLLSAFPTRIGHRIRKALRTETFAWLGVGVTASILGMLPTWPPGDYRYGFAVVMAAATAVLVAVVRMGIANLAAQETADDATMARHLDPNR
ncbi:hypothetical protein [Specibacter cremeus]|uniref:hypothetical protein n=1 Tax=Specibacter cremeus TaxID=1629051 RepID=UPI000F77111E|nr:hypothetical protein [Specibacter cremeus]